MAEQIENHTLSTVLAILAAIFTCIAIFTLEISVSLKNLNILVSGNKALALSALIFLGTFLVIESLSRYLVPIKKAVPFGRRIGAAGLIFVLLHVLSVTLVLNQTFPLSWFSQHAAAIIPATGALCILIFLFLGFTKTIAGKLGEKRSLYIQILGYLALALIAIHTFMIMKPSYGDIGKTILNSFHQLDFIFIAAFLAMILALRIFTFFINKKLSLQAKIIVHTFLFFTVSAVIIGAYIIISDLGSHKEEAFHHNHHMLSYVLSELQNPAVKMSDIYNITDNLTNSASGVPTIFFIDNNKEIIHYPGKTKEGTPYAFFNTAKTTSDNMGWESEHKENGDTVLDTIVEVPQGGYVVASTDFTKSEMGHFDSEILLSSFLIVFVTLVTAVMTVLFTRYNILSPLKKITTASKKIAEGNLDTKIDIKSKDEFAVLAEDLNNMGEKIKAQINDLMKMDKLKNEFIAIASHNLRTPLTTLRGYLDLFETSGKLTPKQKTNLEKAQHSATSLVSLVEGLVNITSLETAGLKIEKDTVDLKSLIENVIEEVGPKAKGKDVTIKNQLGEEEILTIGDKAKLKQAFLAVFENAIKFNKKGGDITVEKIIDDTKQPLIGRREMIITIKDTGIGIAKNERENVFQKFNRGTSTYTYEYEGVGLGLYLARLIIQAHRGRIWFESEEGKGTIFYISLTEK